LSRGDLERQVAGLEPSHGEKADHQSDNDTERDFHDGLLRMMASYQ
jgi:hypothetical protein